MSLLPLSNYYKFLVSKLCMGFYLRGAIGALYLMSKQMDASQAMRLISAYSVLIVLLEYPTGVIGDTYGHKTSVFRGYIFGGVGMLLMCLDMTWWWYLFPLTVYALGSSLESGSDIGLMKNLSDNFKERYPTYKTLILLSKFAAAISAGVLFKISPELPVIVYAILSFTSAVILYTVDDPHISPEESPTRANIFATAKNGLSAVFSSSILIVLLVSYAITNGYRKTIKTTINTLYEFFTVDIIWLTVAIGITQLAGAAGSYASKRLSDKHMKHIPTFIAIITLLMSLLTYTLTKTDWRSILMYFIVCTFLIGAVTSLMVIYISSTVPSSVISSSLSFYNLCARLFTSLYLFGAGYILGRFDVSTLFLVTSVIFFGVALTNIMYSLFTYYSTGNK